MNKKIIITFFIMLLILFIFTLKLLATENTDTNSLPEETTSFEANDSASASENTVTYKPNTYSGSESSYITSVTPVSSQYEANLGLNNILSILLISIGILLILFSIAILIRIKK